MNDCKPTPTPFQSGVTFTSTCTTLSGDPTLYKDFIGSLLHITHTYLDITFDVELVFHFSHET